VTTIARGSGVSRLIPQVLSELHALEKSGVKEIVLTGVHLGSWGKDLIPRHHLSDLVQAILADTNFPRVRLSSLEPWDLNEGFFQLWENPRLCRHLHLPLQSGCAATLRRMARRTTPAAFSALVAAARASIPQVAITTDIIVGFPGENEGEFAESRAFVSEMQFAGGHVFTYSARSGTSAARMSGQVNHALRKERNAEMRSILETSARAYRRHLIGMEMPLLWEGSSPEIAGSWQVDGLTSNYLRVKARSSHPLSNEITHARLDSLCTDGLFGIIR
jgi:threonylcarbamoyladenosine tRNA methylthiotransferase MtaB